METRTLTLEFPKEAYEVGIALEGLLKDLKEAKADGWSTMEDLPTILIKSMQRFMVALEGADKLDDEFKEDALLMVGAVAYPAVRGVLAFLKK